MFAPAALDDDLRIFRRAPDFVSPQFQPDYRLSGLRFSHVENTDLLAAAIDERETLGLYDCRWVPLGV